jgi:hypothetical protein
VVGADLARLPEPAGFAYFFKRVNAFGGLFVLPQAWCGTPVTTVAGGSMASLRVVAPRTTPIVRGIKTIKRSVRTHVQKPKKKKYKLKTKKAVSARWVDLVQQSPTRVGGFSSPRTTAHSNLISKQCGAGLVWMARSDFNSILWSPFRLVERMPRV